MNVSHNSKPNTTAAGAVPTAGVIPTAEAARRLGIKPHTLRVWRLLGRGPRYVRYGGAKTGRCYYTVEDIEAFRAARCFTSTAGETIAAMNPPAAVEAAPQSVAG